MRKLYSSQKITKVLKKHGFVFISQKGSHAKFRKVEEGKTLTTIVAMGKKEIPPGTFHAILRQAGLDEKDFE